MLLLNDGFYWAIIIFTLVVAMGGFGIVLVRVLNTDTTELSGKKVALILCITLAISITLIIVVPTVLNNALSQKISSLDTREQQITATVVSKEKSYTREGNLVEYTITYNYYVTVECETEDGIFSETFDDVDLYESVKKGDTLEVTLTIRYKDNGEVYEYTILQ